MHPPENGEKGRKRAKKADFSRFPGRVAKHPLSPHLLHPHLRQPKTFSRFGPLSQAGKRHINTIFFGPVALATTPGLSRDKPRFSPCLHNGSPVCPRDKPTLSLGQFRGRRAADNLKVYVLKVYVPFSLATRVLLKSVKVRRGRRQGDGTESVMTERPSHAHWFCP